MYTYKKTHGQVGTHTHTHTHTCTCTRGGSRVHTRTLLSSPSPSLSDESLGSGMVTHASPSRPRPRPRPRHESRDRVNTRPCASSLPASRRRRSMRRGRCEGGATWSACKCGEGYCDCAIYPSVLRRSPPLPCMSLRPLRNKPTCCVSVRLAPAQLSLRVRAHVFRVF